MLNAKTCFETYFPLLLSSLKVFSRYGDLEQPESVPTNAARCRSAVGVRGFVAVFVTVHERFVMSLFSVDADVG